MLKGLVTCISVLIKGIISEKVIELYQLWLVKTYLSACNETQIFAFMRQTISLHH
jgi:hypothetical protein